MGIITRPGAARLVTSLRWNFVRLSQFAGHPIAVPLYLCALPNQELLLIR
jgi:hypothetical protein